MAYHSRLRTGLRVGFWLTMTLVALVRVQQRELLCRQLDLAPLRGLAPVEQVRGPPLRPEPRGGSGSLRLDLGPVPRPEGVERALAAGQPVVHPGIIYRQTRRKTPDFVRIST